MILAAADYAEDERKEPPRELEIAFDWYHRRLPPRGGGSLDQPFALMRRLNAAYSVWCAMKAWHESRSMIGFVKSHPEEWRVVQMVLTLRKEWIPANNTRE